MALPTTKDWQRVREEGSVIFLRDKIASSTKVVRQDPENHNS